MTTLTVPAESPLGGPAPGVRIHAQRISRRKRGGHGRPAAVSAVTDDNGEAHLELEPGSYGVWLTGSPPCYVTVGDDDARLAELLGAASRRQPEHHRSVMPLVPNRDGDTQVPTPV